MKKKRIILALVILSIMSYCGYIVMVAYKWDYMQSAIDCRVVAFRAPASAMIFPSRYSG